MIYKTVAKLKFLVIPAFVLAGLVTYWSFPVAESNVVHADVFGVVADDGQDDTAALNAAIADLKQRGGGKLVLPHGQIILSDRLYFNDYGNYVSYDIVGDGTEILVNGNADSIIFYFGNNGRVTISDIVFAGRNVNSANDPQYTDCAVLIFANYVDKLVIRNVDFMGIRAQNAIVYSGIADTTIDSCTFGGSSGGEAAVEAGYFGGYFFNSFRGLTIRNTNFIDYGNYRNENYWKSSWNNFVWVKAETSVESKQTVNAVGQRLVRIEDSRFDEGATVAISVINVAHVKVEGVNVNVSGVGEGRGIDLSGVFYAEIKHSRFGYTAASRPAIRAVNTQNVNTEGISLGGGVYLGMIDSTGIFDLKGCLGNCAVSRAGRAAR